MRWSGEWQQMQRSGGYVAFARCVTVPGSADSRVPWCHAVMLIWMHAAFVYTSGTEKLFLALAWLSHYAARTPPLQFSHVAFFYR